MIKGKVKFYNDMRSFGFITGDDGKDYFFHISGVEGGKTLKEEDKVSFETEMGDRGLKAVKVKLVAEDEKPKKEETEEEPKAEKKKSKKKKAKKE
jgi:CspA family cold shock protein